MAWTCTWCGAKTEQRWAWCPACNAVGGMRPSFDRPAAHPLLDAAAVPETAASVCRRAWDTRWCPRTGIGWASGAMLLIWGPPASGKSTLAAVIAGAAELPVLLVAAEQPPGAALASILRRAGLGQRTDVRIQRQAAVADLVAAGRKGVVVLDSLTVLVLDPEDVRMLADASVLTIGVLQSTKQGEAAGPRSWQHAADAVVRVEVGRWTVEKSRYEPIGRTGEVPGLSVTAEVST